LNTSFSIRPSAPFITRRALQKNENTNTVISQPPVFSSVLFGASKPRHVLSQQEIARLTALREQAESKRKNLPAILQLKYPIQGNRISPQQMEAIESAIAQHPVLQNIDYGLFGENEQRFLRWLPIIVKLLEDSDSFVSHDTRKTLGAFHDPKMRDRLIFQATRIRGGYAALHRAELAGHLSTPQLQEAAIREAFVIPPTVETNMQDYIKRNAATAAKNVTDPVLRDNLIEEFANSRDKAVRTGAAEAAGSMSNPKRRDAIIQKLLYDPEINVGYAAEKSRAQVIRQISDPEQRDAEIKKCADSSQVTVRAVAVKLLKDITAPALRDTLIEKFSDNKNVFGITAAEALPQMSNPERRDVVIEKLAARPNKMEALAKNLALHSDQKRAVALIEDFAMSAHSGFGEPRYYAAVSIGDLADPEVGIALLEKLVDYFDAHVEQDAARYSNDRVKQGAARAAAKLAGRLNNPQRAIAVLEKIANNPDPDDNILSRTMAGEAAGEIEEPKLRDSMIAKFANHPHSGVSRGAARMVAHVSDSSLRDTLIEQLVGDPNLQVRSAAATSVKHLSNPQRANEWVAKLAQDADGFVKRGAARIFPETLIADMNRFLAAVPFYMPMLEESLLSQKDIGITDAMIMLSTLIASGRDAGELKTQVLPAFKKLLDFSKTEANKHLHPNQKPYSNADLEQIFKEHALDIMNLLAKVGDQPLRFKLTQGMEKFTKFTEATRGIASQPELIALLRAVSQRQELSPYAMTQLLEMTAGFSLLGQADKLVDTLKEMTGKGHHIDLKKLGRQYLETFAQVCEFDADIDADSFDLWNLSYMSALAEAYRGFNRDAQYTLQVMMEATMANRFDAFLSDPGSPIGEANLKTAELYQKNGLDIQKWLRYDQTKAFTMGEPSAEKGRTAFDSFMTEFSGEIIKLMGSRKENIKPLVDSNTRKALFQFIKSQGYAFDDNLQLTSGQAGRVNKDNMARFASQLLGFLENKQVGQTLQADRQQEFLTVKSHLTQLKYSFENASDAAPASQNYLIKTWDRNPGYDLFQGNYTQCCIAVDQVNRSAIVDYLTSHAIQIVEIKDLQNDKTIANTFVYWAKAPSGKLVMVADDVEIATQYQGAITTRIRDELSAYLKQYAKQVAGKEVPVLLGQNYNDVPTEDLRKKGFRAQFIGTTMTDELYLDSLGAKWTDITKPHKANFFVF
jgi:HEAT repeat protein